MRKRQRSLLPCKKIFAFLNVRYSLFSLSLFPPSNQNMNGTLSYVNDTFPIPPYLGYDGAQQAVIVGIFFTTCMIVSMLLVSCLFLYPWGKSQRGGGCESCCCGGGGYVDPLEPGCCECSTDNCCFLCCTYIWFRYCRKRQRWAKRKLQRIKQEMQTEMQLMTDTEEEEFGTEEDDEDNNKERVAVEQNSGTLKTK